MLTKRAVILLSGGLDSATVLAAARAEGYECYTMSFDYGQRHRSELAASRRISAALGAVEHKVIGIDLDGMGGSALTDSSLAIPESGADNAAAEDIPLTYVPARNTVFLSLALGWAEVLKAYDIFIGVNDVDYSGYPDCRMAFIQAFEKVANLATREGVEGRAFRIQAPLQSMSKAAIIRLGTQLGVDYALTVSCYQADNQGRACGVCDSCTLRKQGFLNADINDPTQYF